MIDLDKIQSAIKNHLPLIANDESFKSSSLRDTLYTEFSIKPLFYSSKDSFKNEGEEGFPPNNAPVGFEFISGEKYPCIIFNFAVNGNEFHLADIGKSTEFRTEDIIFNSHNSQKYFVAKIYSQTPFLGNDKLLEEINEKAKQKKQVIENSLMQFNKEATETNIKIKNFIEEEVSNEREKRELKRRSMNKLNPF